MWKLTYRAPYFYDVCIFVGTMSNQILAPIFQKESPSEKTNALPEVARLNVRKLEFHGWGE